MRPVWGVRDRVALDGGCMITDTRAIAERRRNAVDKKAKTPKKPKTAKAKVKGI
jgi:hypothetical protein